MNARKHEYLPQLRLLPPLQANHPSAALAGHHDTVRPLHDRTVGWIAALLPALVRHDFQRMSEHNADPIAAIDQEIPERKAHAIGDAKVVAAFYSGLLGEGVTAYDAHIFTRDYIERVINPEFE